MYELRRKKPHVNKTVTILFRLENTLVLKYSSYSHKAKVQGADSEYLVWEAPWIYSVQLKLQLEDHPGRQMLGILSFSSLILNGSKVVVLHS